MSFNTNCLPCSRQTGGQFMPSMQTGFPSGAMMPASQTGTMTPTIPGTMPLYPAAPIGTTLPTGVPAGPPTSPFPVPSALQLPTEGEAPAFTVENILFTPGYMKTQIGRHVKVEFLIGTNMLVDREGTLIGVGASYILIQETETDDILLCDLYSIKFVRFYF